MGLSDLSVFDVPVCSAHRFIRVKHITCHRQSGFVRADRASVSRPDPAGWICLFGRVLVCHLYGDYGGAGALDHGLKQYCFATLAENQWSGHLCVRRFAAINAQFPPDQHHPYPVFGIFIFPGYGRLQRAGCDWPDCVFRGGTGTASIGRRAVMARRNKGRRVKRRHHRLSYLALQLFPA